MTDIAASASRRSPLLAVVDSLIARLDRVPYAAPASSRSTMSCGSGCAIGTAKLPLPLEEEHSQDAAFVNNHLSGLRLSQHRSHAGGCVSVLLRLSGLRCTDETEARRLLRVLF